MCDNLYCERDDDSTYRLMSNIVCYLGSSYSTIEDESHYRIYITKNSVKVCYIKFIVEYVGHERTYIYTINDMNNKVLKRIEDYGDVKTQICEYIQANF